MKLVALTAAAGALAALTVTGCGGGDGNAAPEQGSPAAALPAIGEKTLFAALHDGTIVRSDSGGATWEARATP